MADPASILAAADKVEEYIRKAGKEAGYDHESCVLAAILMGTTNLPKYAASLIVDWGRSDGLQGNATWECLSASLNGCKASQLSKAKWAKGWFKLWKGREAHVKAIEAQIAQMTGGQAPAGAGGSVSNRPPPAKNQPTEYLVGWPGSIDPPMVGAVPCTGDVEARPGAWALCRTGTFRHSAPYLFNLTRVDVDKLNEGLTDLVRLAGASREAQREAWAREAEFRLRGRGIDVRVSVDQDGVPAYQVAGGGTIGQGADPLAPKAVRAGIGTGGWVAIGVGLLALGGAAWALRNAGLGKALPAK